MTPPALEIVPTLVGPNLFLRAPRPSDRVDRQRVGGNGEYRRMVGGDNQIDSPMSDAEAQRWIEDRQREANAWIIEWQEHAIGHARLHQVDHDNRRARYAIGIFDPTCWGRGFGTEATQLVLGYAFDVLHLHRVELLVLTYNQRAIRAYEKAGFVREGIEREGAWIAGRWESDLSMSILEDEYRARYHSTE